MLLIDLLEARRNPTQNPKVSVLNYLSQIASKHPDAFVRFANIPKLGANPHSYFNTPLGIYAYPIDYVLEQTLDVPYARKMPYIIIFVPKNNGQYWIVSNNNFEPSHIDIINRSLDKTLGDHFFDDTDPGIYDNKNLWDHIYYNIKLAKNKNKQLSRPGIVARQVLINADIDGVIDYGRGIIHPNEPNQAVFFNTKTLQLIDIIPNNTINPDIPKAPNKRFQHTNIRKWVDWYVRVGYDEDDGTRTSVVQLLKQIPKLKYDIPKRYQIAIKILHGLFHREIYINPYELVQADEYDDLQRYGFDVRKFEDYQDKYDQRINPDERNFYDEIDF